MHQAGVVALVAPSSPLREEGSQSRRQSLQNSGESRRWQSEAFLTNLLFFVTWFSYPALVLCPQVKIPLPSPQMYSIALHHKTAFRRKCWCCANILVLGCPITSSQRALGSCVRCEVALSQLLHRAAHPRATAPIVSHLQSPQFTKTQAKWSIHVLPVGFRSGDRVYLLIFTKETFI